VVARFIPTGVGNTSWPAPMAPPPPVHPHGRGEHPAALAKADLSGGSSPRAWGTRKPSGRDAPGARFIPTGVGNTSIWRAKLIPAPVHPHGRGEHARLALFDPRKLGSSPRAWGTPTHDDEPRLLRRFIPTGVGNTVSPAASRAARTVHPHGRGEHASAVRQPFPHSGSSPRAWGTRASRPRRRPQSRFIPTGVGNTRARIASAPRRAVHPHGRGEHGALGSEYGAQHGSSPRAWGTLVRANPQRDSQRFIPTGVGNTGSIGLAFDRDSVHPHGRGEHSTILAATQTGVGSSPRAWGTRCSWRSRRGRSRFIPTGVGNTWRWGSCRGRRPVHPHGRGEHRLRMGRAMTLAGSSPRAWGTLCCHWHRKNAMRFIPTGVGNTRTAARPRGSTPVHPHGRGEHRSWLPFSYSTAGSSPRAWGTPIRRSRHMTLRRFIPTGVGNTRPGVGLLMLASGSSPRAWGTHVLVLPALAVVRFIPTGVGNTELCPACLVP